MSQIHQVLQTPAHSVIQKGINPTAARSEGKTWLHLPALIFMIVLTQIPFLLAVWFSLHAWTLLVPSEGFPFVGLTNYINEVVHDPNFWPILGNTLQLVAGAIILALVGGTILALLLNKQGNSFERHGEALVCQTSKRAITVHAFPAKLA
jgi:ABC-type sugar transport system permease subunit